MRCFVAIELPRALVLALDCAGRAICAQDSSWEGEKWADPAVLHLTLKFLGEVSEEALRPLQSDMALALADRRGFSLGLIGLRAVPRPAAASMIWVVVDDPSGECVQVAKSLDAVGLRHGFTPETRRFTPHVTLVRARRPRAVAAEALADVSAVSELGIQCSVSVLSATLFSSELTPHGPRHKALVEFPFRDEQDSAK